MIYLLFLLFIYSCNIFFKLLFHGKHQNEIANRYFVYTTMLVAWLIMSLRDISVGVDTDMYYHFFLRFANVPPNRIFTTVLIEPGWALLAWLVNLISGNFVLFQLVFYGIFCYLCVNFILLGNQMLKRDCSFIITVVFITCCWLLSFNIARQMIAVMFVINALLYYCRHSYRKSIILLIIGISFHYSSILSLSLFLIWKIKDWKHMGFLTISGIALCYFLFDTIMSLAGQMGVYANYVNNGFKNFQESNFSRIVWLIVALHSIWIFMRGKKFSSFDKVVAAFCLIYVFTNIMASRINYFERLGLYFLPFIPLIYPIVGNTFKSRRLRYCYFAGIAVCYSIWFILGSSSPQYAYSISSLL